MKRWFGFVWGGIEEYENLPFHFHMLYLFFHGRSTMFISFQHFSYLFQFNSYQVTMAPINPWIYRCNSTKNPMAENGGGRAMPSQGPNGPGEQRGNGLAWEVSKPNQRPWELVWIWRKGRFLEIFGAVVYPKKRQGRKTPTYHDILWHIIRLKL